MEDTTVQIIVKATLECTTVDLMGVLNLKQTCTGAILGMLAVLVTVKDEAISWYFTIKKEEMYFLDFYSNKILNR